MAVAAITLQERGPGRFIVREANGYRSREQAKIASGSGKIVPGHVLGRITTGAAAAVTPAAAAGNTGNGTVGAVTVDAGATPGTYRALFYAATKFQLLDPGGVEVARGSTGVALDGPINFTITAGGTPFAVGDAFTFPVAFAAGSFAYGPYAPAATNGLQFASALSFDYYDATSADVACTIVNSDCEVMRAELVFSGTPNQSQKDAAYAALAAAGVKFR